MSTTFLSRFAKQSDAVLAAILDQSPDCIKLLNCSGEIEYMNRNGQRALGLSSFEEIANMRWHALWPDEVQDDIDTAMLAAFMGRSYRFTARRPDANGVDRWWDVYLTPIANEHGTLEHVLAITRDVSQLVRDRMGESARREAAEQARTLQGEALREMRHRLKNVLAMTSAVSRVILPHVNEPRQFHEKLENRIGMLSAAQDVMTQIGDSDGVKADAAVRALLLAFQTRGRVKVGQLSADDIDENPAQALALVLGELVGNALSHGALCDDEGSAHIGTHRSGSMLTIDWTERSARAAAEPSQEGAGLRLIRRLGSAPGNPARIEWRPEGLHIKAFIPL